MAMSRRQFMIVSGLAGIAPMHMTACSRKNQQTIPDTSPSTAESSGGGDLHPFPELDARGSPPEIGEAIGAGNRERIARSLQRRKAWFEDLKAFALADRGSRLDPFVLAAEGKYPDVVAELRGMVRELRSNLADWMEAGK